MNLNFWQWLGVILVVIGAILWATQGKKTTEPASPPATQSPQ